MVCQKGCVSLHYLLDNTFIRFDSKLYRQIVGIPMGTNCAPLVAFICYCLFLAVIVFSQIYDKQDDFNFEIVNFPFLDGDVPCLWFIHFATYSFCVSIF